MRNFDHTLQWLEMGKRPGFTRPFVNDWFKSGFNLIEPMNAPKQVGN